MKWHSFSLGHHFASFCSFIHFSCRCHCFQEYNMYLNDENETDRRQGNITLSNSHSIDSRDESQWWWWWWWFPSNLLSLPRVKKSHSNVLLKRWWEKTRRRRGIKEWKFPSFPSIFFLSFLSFALQRTHQRTSDVRCNYFNFSSSFLAIFIIVVCFVISIFFFLRFLQMMIFSFPSLSFLLCERDMNFAYIWCWCKT